MKRTLLGFLAIGLLITALTGCNTLSKQSMHSSASEMETEQDILEDVAEGAYILETGSIISIDQNTNSIILNAETMVPDTKEEILIHSDENTAILSATTGEKIDRTDLKEGAKIAVWVSNAFTNSIPPQTWAYVILTDIEEGTVPQFFKVNSIEKTDTETIFSDASGIKWNVENTLIPTVYENGKESTLDSIQKDTKCLIWPSILPVTDGDNILKGSKIIILG